MRRDSMCTWHLQSSYTGMMCQLSHYAVLWKAWHVHCPISAQLGLVTSNTFENLVIVLIKKIIIMMMMMTIMIMTYYIFKIWTCRYNSLDWRSFIVTLRMSTLFSCSSLVAISTFFFNNTICSYDATKSMK